MKPRKGSRIGKHVFETSFTERPYKRRSDMKLSPALLRAGYRPSDELLLSEGMGYMIERLREQDVNRTLKNWRS